MKICVFGAGAIGCWLGAELAGVGRELSVVARGTTLDSLRANGLTVEFPDRTLVTPVAAASEPTSLGPQDFVVVAVKAPALAQAAERIAPLLGPNTIVLSALNGLPWWFFEGLGGTAMDGKRLVATDPTGSIAKAIPARRVVGAVVHGGFSVVRPGVARCHGPRQLILGDASGKLTARANGVAALFGRSDTQVTTSSVIQKDIWFKLWGNMTVNPISALCASAMGPMLEDELVVHFIERVMMEAREIGRRVGIQILESPGERVEKMRELGNIRTSMLQDATNGKPLEIDAILASVRELGHQMKMETPFTDALLGLTRLWARQQGLY